jgi:hypothetical protein
MPGILLGHFKVLSAYGLGKTLKMMKIKRFEKSLIK